ncbi:precorrin-3B synthase [Acrocarpospora phusangensis]|uniref:Precorrin-3B synthase n=1 Tax=Acrocarpospora phusangensis TaxID=1070424 RepID=A0A919QGM3_9ACTN|nr:nitrite/sulfite reductase [Acrocarpospora phusangensis]GIH28597.1 precorrin-3B synthase [Acrocarpospora phusangensis]
MHEAADGPLARVRVPGGEISAAGLRALAADLGDGCVELTSRANVQVRAVRDPVAFADRIAAAGLLPSATHERVRNIVASPLTGLGPRGVLGVRPLVTALDRELISCTPLAGLPGRFLFALDDGTGDVAALDADVTAVPLAGGVAVLLGGTDQGLRCSAGSAVPLMLAAAESFLAVRAEDGSHAWRLSELPDGPARTAARLPEAARSGTLRDEPVGAGPALQELVGVIPLRDGTAAVGAAVPLGRLSAAQVEVLARLAEEGAQVRLTPWRGVVVLGLTGDRIGWAGARLVEAGLVTDPRSAWIGVSACAGRPGCAKSLSDVQGDARSSVPVIGGGVAVHWAGCERRCGRPRGEVVDVVAVEGGYRVDRGGVSRTHRGLHAVVEDVRVRRMG